MQNLQLKLPPVSQMVTFLRAGQETLGMKAGNIVGKSFSITFPFVLLSYRPLHCFAHCVTSCVSYYLTCHLNSKLTHCHITHNHNIAYCNLVLCLSHRPPSLHQVTCPDKVMCHPMCHPLCHPWCHPLCHPLCHPSHHPSHHLSCRPSHHTSCHPLRHLKHLRGHQPGLYVNHLHKKWYHLTV